MGLTPAIQSIDQLLFGTAPKPLKCGHGIEIGAGIVYPEINFTLPSMDMKKPTARQDASNHYQEMIEGVCQRSVELKAPGLIVELELLPPMTLDPEWGAEITAILRKTMDKYHDGDGLASALRVTPVDIRDNERPILMRSGHLAEKMFRSFELCSEAGADLLSIESTGGKELHDEALLNGDLPGIVYALSVLGVRDMSFLWKRIKEIADRTGSIAAGDTACGFGNTAMVLADKGMIPRVLASVVRVMTVVRSLEAYRQGAQGPSKDCAYEGPFLKVLEGIPIAMEGKSSSCAHLSVVGNVSAACCDMWSNESVQNIRLLSGPAPVASVEQLIYDCRLMNEAAGEGVESIQKLQDWFSKSDIYHDPQAYILDPANVLRISHALAKADSPLEMATIAIDETLSVIKEAVDEDKLHLSETESRWLGMIEMQRETLPDTEEELLMTVSMTHPELPFVPEEYGLEPLNV